MENIGWINMELKLKTKIRCNSVYKGKSKIEFINMIGVGDVLELVYEVSSRNYGSSPNWIIVYNLTHNIKETFWAKEILKYLQKIDHEEIV